MKVKISISTNKKSWITERVEKQNNWMKNIHYKIMIQKLLSLGGKFVAIPVKGEPLIKTLAYRGKKFSTQEVVTVANGRKTLLIEIADNEPERYRMCIGYALQSDRTDYYWVKHFWLFDRKNKKILEFSKLKKIKYFGVMLSSEGSIKLIDTTRGLV